MQLAGTHHDWVKTLESDSDSTPHNRTRQVLRGRESGHACEDD